ncbi:large-conductance mechanosensitive channel protein MscL [Candidatus Laterigemmans baculatus]|uniref:large-conductance mechanosensitive channel protein MscL n=1 Tax=Candidatus Laterigemmans baculatus TaxID=2770505 RepID=UPI00193B8DA5|nr:large-conductance mechanosensitive channel protein MscL [Candidatus Laterigemmans baculatus]
MSMLKEFREFALRGNMIDMAIGIVIGTAFGAVVKSMVDNILMPPIGYLTGGADFSELAVNLPVPGDEPVAIQYGLFINSLISLLIIAAALFLVVKLMNRIRRQFEASPETPSPTTKTCPECQMEIPIKARRCGHCTSVLAA